MTGPLQRALNGLARRLALMLTRALIVRVDDSGTCQTAQLRALSGEVLDGVELPQPFGFSSVPPDAAGSRGAEAFIGDIGGSRSHPVVLASTDRRYRPAGQSKGDVVLHDDKLQSVKLLASGIEMTSLQSLIVSALTTGDVKVPVLAMTDGLPVPIWSITASAASIRLGVGTSYVLITAAGIEIGGPVINFRQI